MEENIQSIIQKYGINEWPRFDDSPKALKLQSLVNEWHKKPELKHFFEAVDNYCHELKYTDYKTVGFNDYYPTYYTSPNFNFYLKFQKDDREYRIQFFYSLLGPYYCYFIKSHKKFLEEFTIPRLPAKTPAELEEISFAARISQMIQDKRLMLDFYLDEYLAEKLKKFDELVEQYSRKYQISVPEWHGNFLYKYIKTHADRYQEFTPTCLWNEPPPEIQEQIEIIIAIQKKHFAFELIPEELLLKQVPDFEVKGPDKTWTPNYFQMMFTKYMPESRVLFFGIGGAL